MKIGNANTRKSQTKVWLFFFALSRSFASGADCEDIGHGSNLPAVTGGFYNGSNSEDDYDLSIQERAQLVRQLRLRAYYKLVIELLILAAFIAASNIFADHGIYGFAQSITGGMSGFVGVLIGSELYALKNLPNLR